LDKHLPTRREVKLLGIVHTRDQEQLRLSKRCVGRAEPFTISLYPKRSNDMFQKLAIGAAVAVAISASAFAQQTTTTAGAPTSHADILKSIPSTATTVTNYYKQNLYDPSDSKIGEIVDVLVGKDGTIAAFIVSVGGFLGMDSKDVAVPFDAVHATQKNGSWYLTMNATKDALKGAPGYKYDKAKANWVPA
jgi:PRC-barrel domain